MSTPATVPAVYAQALLDLAQDQGVVPDIVEELNALQQLCAATPELLDALTAGGQPREMSRAKVKELFTPHFSPLLVNFLSLLSDRGRLDVLPDILKAAITTDEARRGVVRVVATTAIKADATVRSSVEGSLKKVVGPEATVDWQVDESLVAGICLRYNDTLIDGSARRRLADARAAIRSAPLAVAELEKGDVA